MWQEVLFWIIPYGLIGLTGILVLLRSVNEEWSAVGRIGGE